MLSFDTLLSFANQLPSFPTLPTFPTLDEETRKLAIKQTADLLQELDAIRLSLALPPESFKLVMEAYTSTAREIVLERARAKAAENTRRAPMTLRSSDSAYKPVHIKPGEIFSVIGRPQYCEYRVEEIEIDGDPSRWRVHDIKVGNRSQGQQVFLHPIPGEHFRKGGLMSELRLETCQTAMDFIMEVEYIGPLDEGEVFTATLVGSACL